MILSVVCVAVAISIALAFTGDDIVQSMFEAAVTALFAGFVLLSAADHRGIWRRHGGRLPDRHVDGDASALATASGLATRTAANWLLAVFSAIFLLSVAAAVLSAQSSQMTMIVIFLLIATVSGAIGLLLRSTRSREGRLHEQLASRAQVEERSGVRRGA